METFVNFEGALIHLIGVAFTVISGAYCFIRLVSLLYHEVHQSTKALAQETSESPEKPKE